MKRKFLPVLALSLLLSACTAPIQPTPTSEPTSVPQANETLLAMDTVMQLTVYGDNATAALSAAKSEILAMENRLSVTLESSDIWKLNHSEGQPVTVGDDAVFLLETARDLGDKTGGALDVTLYPGVKAWGFTTGEYQIPPEDTIASLLGRVDYTALSWEGNDVTLPAGMEMDLGAIAKGYAGERAADILRDNGVTSALLNMGGNVQTVGAKPDGTAWRIGIRDPQKSATDYLGVLSVIDQAVVTSGGYERFFEEDGVRYWHIMDPKTGAPARSGLTAVTIVSHSGALCDGLSTSLFVMGLEKASDYWREQGDFEAIFINEENEVWITPGLRDSFSLTQNSGYTLHIVEE